MIRSKNNGRSATAVKQQKEPVTITEGPEKKLDVTPQDGPSQRLCGGGFGGGPRDALP